MTTVFINGANRGIGLEFVRQYAADGCKVLAACRAPDQASDLQAIAGDVEIFQQDVADRDSCRALGAALAGRPIDILINNAGILGQRDIRLGNANFEEFAQVLNVNVVGAYRTIDTLIDNVRAGGEKKIVFISSTMGSVSDNSGGVVAYRSSKSALNQVASTLKAELEGEGIIVIPTHPGWVRTDMGGPSALISSEESVSGLRKVISGLTPEDSGRFYRFDGEIGAW
jgi:NAD(P)-dependent dehydrogenase (short-subunit alcohol dehydrogenase family)